VFSGLSVFVNAETNIHIHIEIRVENFQLEQLLSAINQLTPLSLSLSLSLSAIQPRTLLPARSIRIVVATYCLPLPVAQEPYKAALGHDKSAL
jgi:hypothetical protein